MRLALLMLSLTLAAAPASAAVYGIYLNPEDVPPTAFDSGAFDTEAPALGLLAAPMAAFQPQSTVRSLAPSPVFVSQVDAGEPFGLSQEPGVFLASAAAFSEEAPILETPLPGAALLFLAGLVGAGFAGIARKAVGPSVA